MTPDADDASPEQVPDEGWDEAVLVWNATVARIPPPDRSGSARDEAAEPDGDE
ncbi:MAG: hypothetical protein ACRDNI_10960 [Gaiellaceae bacterium]